ncbi:ABC transporter substrate-binding protein [Herbaspirillum lusitanum]|uniref:ABC transporter substrate-binding protein n=1 Tax=Herbaspirillum lusitanum TaxID=213312 RepID=A0ABW9A6I3_9BURK
MNVRRYVAIACMTLSGIALCLPMAAHAQAKVFRIVPQADLKFTDPIVSSNYVTRNFAMLVYDTLFARDAGGVPRPQMVDKFRYFDGGKQWSFTLRPGLQFHDGAPVTAADVVASLERWQAQDNYGRAMIAAGAQWRANDKTTFSLSMKEPFGQVLEALSKSTSLPAVIMPERLIKAAGNGAVTEVIGSGPYKFKRDEWVPGSKVVFVRNAQYVGRSEPVSALAGNRAGTIDRIEWVILPDSNSAMAALKNSEVDMIEQIPPDYINPLRSDTSIKVGATGASQGALVLNTLYPPFNNEKVRQALLHAVDQAKFTTAMGYPADLRMKYCPTFFICGAPGETAAGAEPYHGADLAKARQLLAESGYKGEKVVMMLPSDYPSINGSGLVAIQTMKDIGLKVEVQSMDWPTLVSRRTKKDKPEAGGWSAYTTLVAAQATDSPLSNFVLGAACGNTQPGWPCDKKLDELRLEWTRQTDAAKRKIALDNFQKQAYQSVLYLPLGQFSGAFAARKTVKNIERQVGDVPMLWALDK